MGIYFSLSLSIFRVASFAQNDNRCQPQSKLRKKHTTSCIALDIPIHLIKTTNCFTKSRNCLDNSNISGKFEIKVLLTFNIFRNLRDFFSLIKLSQSFATFCSEFPQIIKKNTSALSTETNPLFNLFTPSLFHLVCNRLINCCKIIIVSNYILLDSSIF